MFYDFGKDSDDQLLESKFQRDKKEKSAEKDLCNDYEFNSIDKMTSVAELQI